MTIYPAPRPVTTNGTPFRDSLADATVNASLWTPALGSGTISEASGTLTLGSGTTANNATSLLSQQTFHLPAKVAIGLSISQRIANQSFFVELVSVNPETGVPDELNTAAFVFGGTNASQARHQVTTGGLPVNQSALSTYPATSAPAKLFELEASSDEVWFHGTNGLDQVTSRSNSYRLQLKAPDPNALYKLRLRWLNGAIAPASNTDALVTYISVGEYEELVTELRNGRGNAVAGNAASVLVAGTVSSAETYPASGGPTLFTTGSATAQVIKDSQGRVFGLTACNTTATVRYLRLFNKSTAPVLGTDLPVVVIAISANASKEILFPGKQFSLGIGSAVTTNAPQLANTLAVSGDLLVSVDYA